MKTPGRGFHTNRFPVREKRQFLVTVRGTPVRRGPSGGEPTLGGGESPRTVRLHRFSLPVLRPGP